MIDLTKVSHHPCIEELTNLLCIKTLNQDKNFYRPLIAYFLAVMASSQRAYVHTKDRGNIPINLYVINLAPSGYGKGLSTGMLEDITKEFRNYFMNVTFPTLLDQNLKNLSAQRASLSHIDQQSEYEELLKQSERAGRPIFVFDSGTTPAVKQYRNKLLLAKCGALNFQCDEIGSNLMANTDLMNSFLELFDKGLIKNKLVKNTQDNVRDIDLGGNTPANCLLFGTQDKIFDGSATEDLFYSFLEIGYARRCLFGIGKTMKAKSYYTMSASEMYNQLIQPNNDAIATKWSNAFLKLANPAYYNKRIELPDDVAIQLLEYRKECDIEADKLPEFAGTKKAELSHRHFKALKLAGALAFIDNASTITMTCLLQAIKLVEESGKSFQTILNRDKPYMKLAKYLMGCDTPQTHADLLEALPFYKASSKNDMMALAQAYAYSQHGLIKKTYMDGIEFFKGESLKATDLDKMILSYSNDVAYGYKNVQVPFKSLYKMTHANTLMHWINHHVKDGHRCDMCSYNKFNMIVIDCDGEINLKLAMGLMKEYTFFVHTTKSNIEPDNNRFRMVIPIAYELELDKEDYKEFMNNILNWLPFHSDEGTNSRVKKWESCSKGSCFGQNINFTYNEGVLLDPLPFIPHTMRNERYQKENKKAIENLDNLARWFAIRISIGNRNNNMIKYALALKDSGLPYPEVEARVLGLNKQLASPLSSEELSNTVLKSVAQGYVKNE